MMLSSGSVRPAAVSFDCRAARRIVVCARLFTCCRYVVRMFVERAPGQKITSKPGPDGMMKVEV